MEQIQSRLQSREINGSIECHDYTDDVSNVSFFIYECDNKITRSSFGIIFYFEQKSLNTYFNEPNFRNFQGKSGTEDISLKLRPTLPKKQLEIPRFSPSAAWRLLSALEAPGPTMSTASEEIPVSA